MSPESLVVVNFDKNLGEYVDYIDIPNEDLNDFARSVGLEQAIQRRAEASGGEARPASVNIHAGFKEQAGLSSKLMFACYNPWEVAYGELPPADIDMFLGSVVLQARDKDTYGEREALVSFNLDLLLKHELIHFADPNMPAQKLKSRTDFLYPGASKLASHPEIEEKYKMAKEIEDRFENRLRGGLLGSVVLSETTALAVHETSPFYNTNLSITAFVATLISGLIVTARRADRLFIKLGSAADEVFDIEHKYHPAEIYARQVLEANPGRQIASISIGSYALRHLNLITKEKYPGDKKSRRFF